METDLDPIALNPTAVTFTFTLTGAEALQAEAQRPFLGLS